MTYMESIRIQNKNRQQVNKNMNKTLVITLITSFTLVLFLLSVNSVFANHANLSETVTYGTMNLFHEDVSYVNYDNDYYVNTLQNNEFVLVDKVIENYTIEGAVKVFNINEKSTEFIYEPKHDNEFLDVLFMYKLSNSTHVFELTHIYNDVSDIDQEVTELNKVDYCEFKEYNDNCDTIPQNIKIPIEHLNFVVSE